MTTVAHVLVVAGLLGVLEFQALSFAARRLATTAVPRLRRRVDHPLARHASLCSVLSATVAGAGLALLPG